MDYRDLKDGKYLLKVKERYGYVVNAITREVMFSKGKEYVMTVNDGTYSFFDDCDKEEQIATAFPCLDWFEVSKIQMGY